MAYRITYNFFIYYVQNFPFSLRFDKFNPLFYPPSSPLFLSLVLYFLQLQQGDGFQILNETVVFEPLFHLRP